MQRDWLEWHIKTAADLDLPTSAPYSQSQALCESRGFDMLQVWSDEEMTTITSLLDLYVMRHVNILKMLDDCSLKVMYMYM